MKKLTLYTNLDEWYLLWVQYLNLINNQHAIIDRTLAEMTLMTAIAITCESPGCSCRLCREGRHHPCPAWSAAAGGCSRTTASPSGRGRNPPSSAYAWPPSHSPGWPFSSLFPVTHETHEIIENLLYIWF